MYVYNSFGTRSVSSVPQSCPTLCSTMNRSTPGLRVHHQFPESTQTHVHMVGDAIQPSHPLSLAVIQLQSAYNTTSLKIHYSSQGPGRNNNTLNYLGRK